MIDNLDQTQRLLPALEAVLPLEARIGPQLAATIRDKIPGVKPFQRCQISRVFYTGDEGGIICGLDLPEACGKEVYFVSITHLMFSPRAPLAREITAYQKHRIKRLQRQGAVTQRLAANY
jgi:hypothetical protein